MSKTIAITGGCGWLGHHVIEAILKDTDWKIVVIDKRYDLKYLQDIAIWPIEGKRVSFVIHDLKEPISSDIALQVGHFDYLAHLAAEINVAKSLENSIPYIQNNCLGTAQLLEWLKTKDDYDFMLNISTDAVFGSAFNKEHHEYDSARPCTPYAATKAFQESICYAFSHAFKLPISTIRCTNLFGERQSVDRFVPSTIRNILTDSPITLFGNKASISSRFWVHCREVANSIIYVLKNGTPKEHYHIIGKEMSVHDIAELLMDTLDKKVEIKFQNNTRAGYEIRQAIEDNTLSDLGYKPSFTADEGIRRVARWYLSPKNQRWLSI